MAHRVASSRSDAHRALRGRVAEQMQALSAVWDLDGGRSLGHEGPPTRAKPSTRQRPTAGAQGAGGIEGQEVTFMQANADGSTEQQTVKMTADMLKQLKEVGGAGAVDMLAKLNKQ